MFHVKNLAPCLCAAAALLPAGLSRAATVEQDIQALAGHWEGDAHDGTKVTFALATGQGDLTASGSWKVDAGTLAGASDFTILHTGTLFFMVPDKSPFTPGKDAYSFMHLPSGGLRFSRLVHPAPEDAVNAVQAEEVEIGKVRPDGTRTLKMMRGERICVDETSPAGKPCGQGLSESIILHKVAE